MAKTVYTVLVVPDRSSSTMRFRVPRATILRFAAIVGVLALAAVGAMFHYAHVVSQVTDDRAIKEENVQLRGELLQIQQKVATINKTLDRVEQLDQKLRQISMLSDPDRNLAIGPVGTKEGEGELDGKQLVLDPEDGPTVESKLDSLSAEAAKQEQSLQELQEYFEDQKSLLASAPSVWPARGFVTSDFGHRLDPYTAERTMHKGLDIGVPFGTTVVAPADGTVVFASTEGGYGNVLVLDHGYGIKTRYGHLSQILVKAGQKVHRGDKIALSGNTGRSTGPHVHYEVRVNGIPQNPRKFILE
ncbi:MAG: peptidoglycan DD-metalloendopeptidase family protein [Deltaproteobacteria bacterium]|nr:peptidoglycan DD-metalloendopeptidase family protein [Deltaproteobacteria bacterium]